MNPLSRRPPAVMLLLLLAVCVASPQLAAAQRGPGRVFGGSRPLASGPGAAALQRWLSQLFSAPVKAPAVRTTTLPDGREAATVDFVALPVKATIKPDGQVRFEDPDAQLKRNATADPQDDTADLTRADPVTEAVQAIGGLLGGAAPDVIQGLVGAVSGAVNGAIQGAAGAAGGAVQGAAGAANGAIQGAVGAVNGAAGALTGALNAVGGAVNGTLDPDGDGDIELTVNPTLSLTLTPFSLDPTLQLAANPTLSPTRQSTLAASTLAPSLSGVLSPTKQPSLFEGARGARLAPSPP
ncbi:hypothetical protein MNEG_11316 [Monoraphidium neglectum]|uniref:Uncharacterized protein n=1 Tax=Monoraphidium neglectum TaxID=145388 RepID=A0A0D2KLR0_9CHLO|nr:hypothetical protein MNEG_11316 [Monoraphidium neglectum]KIY96648.1 hypothetical protein MNEG_11316 [Monoraphidium neglectum]|eukprot:XP_013895668.1 hypothetical protein MNEG_11316 [Monoraphidium neglectum]